MKVEIKDLYPKPIEVYIGGVLVNKDDYDIDDDESSYDEKHGLSLIVNGILKNQKLLNNSLDDFPTDTYLQILEEEPYIATIDNNSWIERFVITFQLKENNYTAELEFYLDSALFEKNITFAQYTSIVKEILKADDNTHKVEEYFTSFESGLMGAKYIFQDISISTKVIDEVNRLYLEVNKKIQNSQDNIYKKNNHIILTSYMFPDEIKNSCEQYLLYFAQFLQELGISVNSELKEDAGKILFSVTPTDDTEALDKIREALAIYLRLPSSPIPNSTGDRTVDMVLSGVRANIKHLESQIELSIAKLQFKEATLELKDATIEQNQLSLRQKNETITELQEMLSRGNIFEESLESVEIDGEVIDVNSLYRFSREDDIEIEATTTLDEKNEEARIGLVKFHEVTKLKDYGVSLDLPKAIRDLIDYFKRDKNDY